MSGDLERSANRLKDVREGLGGENDWYWRDAAQRRIDALTEDEKLFGLVPHELQERAALQRMLRHDR